MAEDKKAFTRTLNATPDLTRRIVIGEDGILSENMTLEQFLDFVTTNLDVFTKDEINTLLANYLAKDNLTIYTPTQDYHPATKKYADEVGNGVINNSLEQGWTKLGNDMRLQWFKVVSTIDGDQVFNFPYPFPANCVNITMNSNMLSGVDVMVKNKDSFTLNRDDNIDGNRTVYIQAIGY